MNEFPHLTDRINHFLAIQLEQISSHQTGQLQTAMKYTLLNGGKRMRPLMVYATANSIKLDLKVADYIAAAIEMIHAYSLIHDDLPAMDDDDLRRGQPTCHIKFDEATAILAADALQTLAFETLTDAPIKNSLKIKVIKSLAKASGGKGMIGGQMLDLEAEEKIISLLELQNIHAKKTGALLLACVSMVIDCVPSLTSCQVDQYLNFGKNFGMAYQIIDDILDVTSDTDTLGKPAQSDIKNQKSTYPSILGLDLAKQKASEYIESANNSLSGLPNAQQLILLTNRVSNRAY